MKNIILCGFMGSGKTVVGRELAKIMGCRFVDTDELIEQEAGTSCGDYLRAHGEAAFREIETRMAAKAGKESGTIIATGGGIVTREENRNLLRQNGKLIHLDRPIEALATEGDRPLSRTPEALADLYRARAPLYAAWRDLRIGSTSPEEAAERILEALT
jgi:shikimate dehydrogenase